MLAPRQVAERWTVHGQVQAVGFRPFIFRLARRLGLRGSVANTGAGVDIHLQGAPEDLERFHACFLRELPPAARIDTLERQPAPWQALDEDFSIQTTGGGTIEAHVPADLPVCENCLRELFDPADRRYRYPLINCMHCGPRYTLIRKLPYDRPHTTMSGFELCDACRQEYEDPDNRRFHAEPIACAECGPGLRFVDAGGNTLTSTDAALTAAVELLRGGGIVAVKGVGGYHLMADANRPDTVAHLRERKRRPDKPFAVMALNTLSAQRWVRLDASTETALSSTLRPIVLAPALALPEGVAPGMDHLGLVLPQTPLQYLIYHHWLGQPRGLDWLTRSDAPLFILTSANLSGEPLIHDDQQALDKLGHLADGWLLHDRPIYQRCDDPVVQTEPEQAPILLRPGRGTAPTVLTGYHELTPMLALGAHLKTTVALSRPRDILLSQYVGDLDHPDTCRALDQLADHLTTTYSHQPQVIVCDRHPDLYSTRLAEALAERFDADTVRVPHHTAHLGAVMAEHGRTSPTLGLILDGFGYGEDGGYWGGELLYWTGHGVRRLGHLDLLPLPGGDAAAREPWRLAIAALCGHPEQHWPEHLAEHAMADLMRQWASHVRTPRTSSAGRWFDAVTSLLGLCQTQSFEGQAPQWLEACARRYTGTLPDCPAADITPERLPVQDLIPVLLSVQKHLGTEAAAAAFHHWLAQRLAAWAEAGAAATGVSTLAISGGCWMNRLLTRAFRSALPAHLNVLEPRRIPANDSGLSVGQIWAAHFGGY
ncbi:MAG: carbamoyltransferase HypF [Gammaproteobacteria bacterium]|nr:MAG: carbamoyltransferase HypF [Gammaproteobacteria bacterium]